MTNWEALGKEADLKQAQLERRRTYVDSKERREAMDSLLSKGYEHVFDYKNQNFVKMRKPKTFDICWENKVWLLFRNMGFDIMNKDSSFKISYSRNNPDLTQQIDVFAADEETVIIVECKSSQTPGTKREFKPVSYTHLDVYKRQLRKRSTAPYISDTIAALSASSSRASSENCFLDERRSP